MILINWRYAILTHMSVTVVVPTCQWDTNGIKKKKVGWEHKPFAGPARAKAQGPWARDPNGPTPEQPLWEACALPRETCATGTSPSPRRWPPPSFTAARAPTHPKPRTPTSLPSAPPLWVSTPPPPPIPAGTRRRCGYPPREAPVQRRSSPQRVGAMQRVLVSSLVAATPRWLPLADSILRRHRPRSSPLPMLWASFHPHLRGIGRVSVSFCRLFFGAVRRFFSVPFFIGGDTVEHETRNPTAFASISILECGHCSEVFSCFIDVSSESENYIEYCLIGAPWNSECICTPILSTKCIHVWIVGIESSHVHVRIVGIRFALSVQYSIRYEKVRAIQFSISTNVCMTWLVANCFSMYLVTWDLVLLCGPLHSLHNLDDTFAPGYSTGGLGPNRGRSHKAFQWHLGKLTNRESIVMKACFHISCGGKRFLRTADISTSYTSLLLLLFIFSLLFDVFRKWRSAENRHLCYWLRGLCIQIF
jgi:hypothetical protein